MRTASNEMVGVELIFWSIDFEINSLYTNYIHVAPGKVYTCYVIIVDLHTEACCTYINDYAVHVVTYSE